MGLVGYRTPNIDRIANEGMIFTDYYGEQSCTAGRSSFITGQSVFRTGLSKVGLPGAELGHAERKIRPSPASSRRRAMRPGSSARTTSATRTSILPTNHGFDEFFGNLYHLNAEEEPENEDYPEGSRSSARNSVRAASSIPGPLPDGTQKIEDTGPLTKKRMETVDDETSDARHRLHRASRHKAGKPWFVWWNGTRMHFRTHVKTGAARHLRPGRIRRRHGRARHAHRQVPREARRAGHRRQHHRLLLDRQRPAHQHLAGRRPRRPSAARRTPTGKAAGACPPWCAGPGKIKAGFGHQRRSCITWTGCRPFWPPPAMPDIKDKLLKGDVRRSAATTRCISTATTSCRCLTGQTEKSPRKEIFYFSDDGDLTALRYKDWKMIFMEQKPRGPSGSWMEPFVPLRVPLIENLRRDPYERGDDHLQHLLRLVAGPRLPAGAGAGLRRQIPETFKEFPPRQKAGELQPGST